jgi:(p)ppGpp synthase/HD superfamily hydrolase
MIISKPTLLEKAIQIALDVHTGQKDKAGLEYVLHPLRVMQKMETPEQMITAILHDVIEDSQLTIEDLATHGFDIKILDAIALLTRDVNKDSYEQSITKIKKNDLAIKVKLADLEDNMNVKRIKEMTNDDLSRLKKYNKAWHELSTA